jgi:hypothetical protein
MIPLELGSLLFALRVPLALLFGGGLVGFVYLRYVRRGRGNWIRTPERTRVQRRTRPMLDEKAAAERDFLLATGMSRGRHYRLMAGAAIAAFLAAFLLLGSWGAGIGLAIAAAGFINGRAQSALERQRSGLLADEVVPAARGLAASMAAGTSLSAAVTDYARSLPETPLKVSLRRALSDPRGLEDGLRAESGRPDQPATIVEFYDLLAEGASTSRETAAAAETLERFADVSQRQRTSYQAAMRVTSEARGTRTIIAMMIPVGMAVNFFSTGGTSLQGFAGNVLAVVTAVLLYVSFIVTDRIIRGILKGF